VQPKKNPYGRESDMERPADLSAQTSAPRENCERLERPAGKALNSAIESLTSLLLYDCISQRLLLFFYALEHDTLHKRDLGKLTPKETYERDLGKLTPREASGN
jgi:hypothetical protein